MWMPLLWLTLAWTPPADYPKTELLIEATDLMTTKPTVVLDVRTKKDYTEAHIPGAIWVDAKAWDRAFNTEANADAWGKRLGKTGIDSRVLVVIYGDDDVRDAARIWWILRYWGIKDARLLNGGWSAWKAAGGKMDTQEAKPEPRSVTLVAQQTRLATKAQLLEALNGQPPQIIDARSEGEHCRVTNT